MFSFNCLIWPFQNTPHTTDHADRDEPHERRRLAQRDGRNNASQHEAQTELVICREDARRDQPDEHAAERATGRHDQVEPRQVARRRPQPGELAVEKHAACKKPDEIQRNRDLYVKRDLGCLQSPGAKAENDRKRREQP